MGQCSVIVVKDMAILLRTAFLRTLRIPGSDPAAGEVSPKQGSGGKACQKTEPSQTQKQTGVKAHSKPKVTAPRSAKPRVCSRS